LASSSTDLKPESSTSLEQDIVKPVRTVRSILLVGASVRSLAESAINAGLRPLCVDFFEDSDLSQLLARGRGRFLGRIRSFTDVPQLTHSVRASVPLLWAGGLENHSPVLRALAQRRPVIGPDPDTLDRLRAPANLFQWLTDAGLASPRLATMTSADSHCDWLQKPFAGSGGLGIKAHSGATVPSPGLPSPSRQLPYLPQEYLQEYIDGVPMSAVCCSNRSRTELIGCSLQLIGWRSLGASDFLFCGNVGPVHPGDALTRQLQSAADTVVSETGLRGVFGLDFMLRQGVAWFLEVNPRLTASHMLFESPGRSTGPARNLVRQHLAAFGWQPSDPAAYRAGRRWSSESCASLQARFILWATDEIPIPGDAFPTHATASEMYRLADVPPPTTTVPAGAPICSVHLVADSRSQLVKSVEQLHPSTLLSQRFSWPDISRQLALLLDRFERNIVPQPELSVPQESRRSR